MAESLIAHPSKATMVRLLRQVLLAAGLLSAACSASVIRPVDEARLASRELFYYYDIDTSMSIPCSKSFKSKKAKLPPPPPSKSSKSKMPPPPKYPKGCKQPKGTKSPKGKGKGFLPTKTPTEPKTKAPVPNIPTMPTIPIPTAPSVTSVPPVSGPPATVPPGSPTGPPGGTTVVQATDFEIAYTVSQTEIPTSADYDGLTELTSAYLNQTFRDAAVNLPQVIFVSSLTMRTGQDFNLNQPVLVQYNTTATFDNAGTIPTSSELDTILNFAFVANAANYQTQLASLQSNIFSTTTTFTFSQSVQSTEKDSSTSTAAKTAGIAVAAGAGAFILLIGAIAVHRNRRGNSEDDSSIHKFHEDGHMTVAGDTYAGTLSLDSGRQHTEEDGLPSGDWEGFAKYSTAEYRTNSPSSGNDSDSGESSDGSTEQPQRTLENVDL